MRVYITQQVDEYRIFKVSDNLIDAFKDEYGPNILIEGKSIQEAIIQFSELEKTPEIEFNSDLLKYKRQDKIEHLGHKV